MLDLKVAIALLWGYLFNFVFFTISKILSFFCFFLLEMNGVGKVSLQQVQNKIPDWHVITQHNIMTIFNYYIFGELVNMNLVNWYYLLWFICTFFMWSAYTSAMVIFMDGVWVILHAYLFIYLFQKSQVLHNSYHTKSCELCKIVTFFLWLKHITAPFRYSVFLMDAVVFSCQGPARADLKVWFSPIRQTWKITTWAEKDNFI